jgi:hypothetical protein
MGWLLRIAVPALGGFALLIACTGGPDIGGEQLPSSSSGVTSTSSGNTSGLTSTSGYTSTSGNTSGLTSTSSGGTGSQCHRQTDCHSAGDLCIGGNVPAGCGGAYIHDCDTDQDCRKDGGVKVCQHGDCSGANRCIDQQCTGQTCGTNQTCTDNQCVAKSCTVDTECVGYCVNSVCSTTLGSCGKQAAYP